MKAANRATVFIENYANIQVVTVCSEKLKKHWTRVYKLDRRTLTKIVAGYMKDFSPLKLVPKNGGAVWLVLWLPFTITTIVWLSGLALVLTIPLITFLLGFLLWTAAWLPVAILPPLPYSLAYLVVPNTEDQFSQPFLGLSKIWQLFQDPVTI